MSTTSNDASSSSTSREELLQSHVAQLKAELQKERAETRQIHHDKVREIKTVREKEQANAREQLENLKLKLQKEKAQELQEEHDRNSNEFHQRMKTAEKQFQDQLHDLKNAHELEKQKLVEKTKTKISQEVEEALRTKFECASRKMQRELFEIQQQLHSEEEKNTKLMDGERNTVNVLRDVEKQHRTEIENLHKQHRLALKKQFEESDVLNRKLQSKDKELAKLTERLSRTEADKDKLQDEVKRLKQAESWTRRSSTPPSLSPSSSMNDLVSKRERDMVMKNSELSFRVRTLEDNIAKLRQENSKLQSKLSESMQQLAPLEEQKVKLGHRVNDLNSSLRSREKKIEHLSKMVITLKSEKQQLEEETARQRKSLQQQMSISSSHRTEKEKLKEKNSKLQLANSSLSDRLENLMSENEDLRLSLSPPPHSVMSSGHLSPTSTAGSDSSLSSSANSSILQEQLDQLQFDKDESQAMYEESQEKYEESRAKYQEMKGEYVDLRARFKQVQSNLQGKYRDLQTSCTLQDEKLRILEKEHRDLEHELVLLRRSAKNCPSHDVKRTILDTLQKQLKEKTDRIHELEDFIVEQDEVARKSEDVLRQEKMEIEAKLMENCEAIEVNMEQKIDNLQTELGAANELLESKQNEIEQFQLQLQLSSVEDEGVSVNSPLTSAQLEHCIQQYKTQVMQLDEKNTGLQGDLVNAIEQVSKLQELTVELEGRLEKDHNAHEAAVSERDEEIHFLNQKLTQLETKLLGQSMQPPDVFDEVDSAPPAPTSPPPDTPLMSSFSSPPTSKATPPTTSPATPPIASPSILTVSNDFTKLPLTHCRVLADGPAVQDNWCQTTPPPSSLHQSSQTVPTRNVVAMVNSSTQTTSAKRPMALEQWTQTLSTSRAVVMERSVQTDKATTPRRVERSIQTAKVRSPRRVERSSQTITRRKTISVDNWTQTPQSQRQLTSRDASPSHWSVGPLHHSPAQLKAARDSRRVLHLSHQKQSPSQGMYNGHINSVCSNWSKSLSYDEDEGEQPAINGVFDDVPRVFVAVMDYDPNSLCTTGRPDLELAVNTGDVVCVEGEMDDNGYYRASFGGHTGLLPANFIQETEVVNQMTRERLVNQSLSHNWSCSSSPVSYRDQQRSQLTRSQPSREASSSSESSPQAPLSFHVEKVLGHDGLLVAWQPPPMDTMCRSNGFLVTGYQIYVNGLTESLVSGASQSKTVLSGVLLNKTLKLGISTSSIEGKCSRIVEIVYRCRPISISRTSPEPEASRTFVALYDYDPVKCSPNENPEFELSFKEGDIILVQGQEKDGFLVGELNGRRGWVPAMFITPVSRNKDHVNSHIPLSTQMPGEAHVTSRKMVALYTYSPLHVSPNPNPDAELAFRAGDVITIYGYMQSDGFYSGELNGRCGLVPSNFLREIQQSDTP